MEDYIYILLGVVWILYSVYKASKKSKERKAVSNEDESYEEAKPVDQALREIMLGISQQPEPRVEEYGSNHYIEVEEEEYEPVINKTKFKLDTIPAVEGATVFGEKEHAFSESVIYDHDAQESENLRDYLDFDLRKAVIYNEILNRPYQ